MGGWGDTGGGTGGGCSDTGLTGLVVGSLASLPRLLFFCGTGGFSAFCCGGVFDVVDDDDSMEFKVSLELLIPESALLRLRLDGGEEPGIGGACRVFIDLLGNDADFNL